METQTVEYKQTWRDDFLKEICGFANAQGGTLYVGIDDNGEVVGVDNAKELLENLPNKIYLSLKIMPVVHLLEHSNKQYIQVSVPHSEIAISYKGKYYFRSGSTTQELGGADLQSFLISKTGKQWDDLVCEGSSLDDIDAQAVDYFLRHSIRAGRMPSEAMSDSIETVLSNLNLLTENNTPKNAAILIFGKNPQRRFINARFRIGRFMDDDTDLVRQDEIDGNILQMADKVIWKLRTDYLTANISYEGMHRVEQLEIPEMALRELVYNAIVHRDYLGVDTQMKVYNDRIWLWNEGELPIGFDAENENKEHISKPRNKLIANVFYKAGFIESWGRGISKVCKDFASAGLQKPTFTNFWNGSLVQIQRPATNLLTDQVTGLETDQVKLSKLKENQLVVYLFIKNHDQVSDQVTTGYIAKELGTSYSTVKRILSVLKSNDLVYRVGSDKYGYWKAR